jgi:transglutaminase-like putative cysteine protease
MRSNFQKPLVRAQQLGLNLTFLLLLLPLLAHLPLFYGGALLLLLAYHALQWRFSWPVLPAWFLVSLSAVLWLLVWQSLGTVVGLSGGTAVLVGLVALKLLEARDLRDGNVMLFLLLFLFAPLFFYIQDLWVPFYALGVLFVILWQWQGLLPVASSLSRDYRSRRALFWLLQVLPLALILFVFFPRLPGPLWNMPLDSGRSFTGLSEEMEPGNISDLAQSNKVAFRVKFLGAVPPPEVLYWRGPVLTDFDGRRWRQPFAYDLPNPEAVGLGGEVEYIVTLEPHGKDWLFALDLPESVPDDARMTIYRQLRRRLPVTELIQYRLRSNTHYWFDVTMPIHESTQALRLPPGFNPRTVALAESWRQEGLNDAEIVARALRLFWEQEFYYTLRPPLLQQRHTIDQFLFETRRGFCEHYAAAFVVLVRAAGIPARVVTGYQGGEWNANGQYLLVRQAEAHAWTEVWLNDGWQRVDPTAAVSPNRVQSGLDEALSQEMNPFFRRDFSFWHRSLLQLDAWNNAWNYWVLSYGAANQQAFLQGLGLVNWELWIMSMIGSILALTLLFGLLQWFWRWRARQRDPVQGYFADIERQLQRLGIPSKRFDTLSALVMQVQNRQPQLLPLLEKWQRAYQTLRFQPTVQTVDMRQFRELTQALRRELAKVQKNSQPA